MLSAVRNTSNAICRIIRIDELKAHYQRGGLGDVKVKRFLNAIMQETLEPIRNRRKEFSKDIPAVYEMLQKGCEVASCRCRNIGGCEEGYEDQLFR